MKQVDHLNQKFPIENLSALKKWQEACEEHALFQAVKTQRDLKIFMESHVFAVWDFMSLLKRLQRDLTTTTLPWYPVDQKYKKASYLINSIVLGEESDTLPNGDIMDHFSLYLKSMEEVQASRERIDSFMAGTRETLSRLKPEASLSEIAAACMHPSIQAFENDFVAFNLQLSLRGKIHEVAAAFFFGREKLIPEMFTNILHSFNEQLNLDEKFPHLSFYLKRHIEVDGDEHGPLAFECLEILCDNDPIKWQEALKAGELSLQFRARLWDGVLTSILGKA